MNGADRTEESTWSESVNSFVRSAVTPIQTLEDLMLRNRRLALGLAIALLFIVAGGCTFINKVFSGKTVAVSGETLDGLSLLFDDWSKESTTWCTRPRPATRDAYCTRSADFQGYFRPAFLQASGLWRVAAGARIKALESGNTEIAAEAARLQKAAEEPINVLGAELRKRLAEGK